MANPGGITTTYVYDVANRLSQVAQGTLTWTFAYDNAGNRTRLTHPNGTSTDYAYLNNHWLQAISDKAPGGATFQITSYTYDPNENRTNQADSSGTTAFAYDALNRMTRAAYPGVYCSRRGPCDESSPVDATPAWGDGEDRRYPAALGHGLVQSIDAWIAGY